MYLKTAVKTANEAGKIFAKFFGHPKNVTIKEGNKRNFVTEVDLSIERLIRNRLLSAFPDHKIIGEELGLDKIGTDDKIWVIDPIDGTTNFIHGVPFCCISIALWDNKGPLVGVVYNPISGALYTAQRGGGAFLNSKKISVTAAHALDESFGGIGWGRDTALAARILPKLLKQTNKTRVFGSAALETCLVASGNFDFYIHGKLSIWDAAAAILIVKEAGGMVTDWQGKLPTLQLKSIVAGNPKLHKKLMAEIKKL